MIELPITFGGARRSLPSIEVPRPQRPALLVAAALDRVRRAPSILLAMRTLPSVLGAVDESLRGGGGGTSVLAPIRAALEDENDTLAGLAAVHALARVPGARADEELATIILEGRPGFEQHAIWASIDRPAALLPLLPLARAVAHGGMAGMLAQRALGGRARQDGDLVLSALETVLAETDSPSGRRYLVETVGLLPGRYPGLALERVAGDPSEQLPVRVAAVAAFSERTSELLPTAIADLARRSDELGDAVAAVRARRSLARRGPRRSAHRGRGIRVAQIHLAAVLDPDGANAGVGEAGGVATLLARLASALADQPRIAEIVTIGRALPGESGPLTRTGDGRRDERIPLSPGEGATFGGRWPAIVEAVRGVRAALLAGDLPDVVHLRMADPGSLAGAMVAAELRVPTVFSLAPDPHGPIAAAEAAGTLDRRSFAAEDAKSALWYRANLVGRLARDARELVLFPRPEHRAQLLGLTGIDVGAGPPNRTIVAEGIDTARTDRAASRLADATASPSVIADLERAIAALPAGRHGLPLVISVGRLQEAKGMARLVGAFAADSSLAARANLVIVGGDLDDPSSAEAAELARIGRLFERHAGLAERVVLLGHRPNDDVALLLALARQGRGALIGPGGSYACGSYKEEFGLAIIEAMAAGLPVVAPRAGGPATYVEDGISGALVDTTDHRAIAAGLHLTLDLAGDPLTASRTRSTVEERFTLERMARILAAVYRIAAGATTLGFAVEPAGETARGAAAA